MEDCIDSIKELAPVMFERLGYMFYIVNPNRTSFANREDVPIYATKVVPYFAVFLALEYIVAKVRNKKVVNINDGIVSLSQAIFQELIHAATKGLRFIAYIYIYENWRLMTLPWDSIWTWVLCFIGVDFCFYWLHRACHEINILWATHQTHHSSEYYNLTTALRQALLFDYGNWIFYLPLAFCIPPSVFLVHKQFNLIYQFWIHTEVIESVGPLEYILNTPSHHRVHHGRNRYCIDKNYAGVLIIWDRMFGTFQAEDKEVVYGLTHPINSFSPFYIQFGHCLHICRTAWNAKGFKHKLSVIFKGPGWEPGKPWHGLMEDIPDVHAPMEVYDPEIAWWRTAYVASHFGLIFLAFYEVTDRFNSLPQTISLGVSAYLILSITAIGALLDGRSCAPWIELVRCILFALVDYYFLPFTRIFIIEKLCPATISSIVEKLFDATILTCAMLALRLFFICSALLWLYFCIKSMSTPSNIKSSEKCH